MKLRDTGLRQQLSCAEFMAGHSDYLDGLLVATAAMQWQAHRDACAACARYDRTVRASLELVHALPAITPSEDFEQRLQHRLFHLQDAAVLERPRTGAGAAVAFAAAATLAALAWSPLLFDTRLADTAAPAASQTASFAALNVTQPAFGTTPSWYDVSAVTPVTRLISVPGPHSPLIVTPPVHRSVRTVSTERAPLD